MKFLAIGFLFVLFLSVTLAMTSNAQNVPNPGFGPKDGSPSCHGGGRRGGRPSDPESQPSTVRNDTTSATTSATVTTAASG